MEKRLITAMAAYAVLAAIALLTLHGLILKAILILLAALAAKTLIAWRAGW
ncbi:MAG: hypothetical protein ABSB15_06895 [Bryobacteraceae bacterium]|jgi:hypothetical protein